MVDEDPMLKQDLGHLARDINLSIEVVEGVR